MLTISPNRKSSLGTQSRTMKNAQRNISVVEKQNIQVEKLLNLLWENRHYISIKLSEEVLEKLKDAT